LNCAANIAGYLFAGLLVSVAGCSDFQFDAQIDPGRFEVHEIGSDGREGRVTPPHVLLPVSRSSDSMEEFVPVRLRLVFPGEPDRELMLYSVCAAACNGSVDCKGKTVEHETSTLIIDADGHVNAMLSSWECTFDDDTKFLILS
jgi:hypothetical protein